MQPVFYDPSITYEENDKRGPALILQDLKPRKRHITKKTKFLDFDINVPFGIPAGPLLNSAYCKAAFDFGFDINYYKTRRSIPIKPLPFPNVLFVQSNNPVSLEDTQKPVVVKKEMPKSMSELSITNSFGNPSQEAKLWQEDMRKAVSYAREGQLLIASVVGTIQEGFSEDDYYNDFAHAAELANETGVKVIEINLSCPNVSGERHLCFNPDAVESISKKARAAVGNKPLLVKFGYFSESQSGLLEDILKRIKPYVAGIAVINGIPGPVVDEDGNQALPGAPSRLISGICGAVIKNAGLDMVDRLYRLRDKTHSDFAIIGMGGVMTADDYYDYRKAGADVVQSATGAMWNPYLAYEIWQNQSKIV